METTTVALKAVSLKVIEALRLKQLSGVSATCSQSKFRRRVARVSPTPVRQSQPTLKTELRSSDNSPKTTTSHQKQIQKYMDRVKTLRQQQKTRLELLQKQQTQRELAFEAEDRLVEAELQQVQAEKQLLYSKKLQDLQEKAQERKKLLTEVRNNAKRGVSYTPLYKIKETEFVHKVELPELEQRKEILQQMRAMKAPISYGDLKKHEQECIRRSKSVETKPKKQILLPPAPPSFAQRRKDYDKQVKTFHKPTIDTVKQKELAYIKERIKNPVSRKIYSSVSTPLTKPIVTLPPKPKEESPPPIKSKNYLKQLREAREVQDQRILQSIQEQAYRRYSGNTEKILRRIMKKEGTDLSLVQAETSLAESILSEVHAKANALK